MARGTSLQFAALSVLLFTAVYACSQTTGTGNSPAHMIYVASTPCGEGTKPVPGISKDAPCDFINGSLNYTATPRGNRAAIMYWIATMEKRNRVPPALSMEGNTSSR